MAGMIFVRDTAPATLAGEINGVLPQWQPALDMIRQRERPLRIALLVLLTLWVFGLAFDLGAWTSSEHFRGPFRVADTASGIYAVEIGRDVPFFLGVRLSPVNLVNSQRNPRLM